MKNGEHHDSVASNRIEDAIRETPGKDAPELAMKLPMCLGIGAYGLKGTVDFGKEILAQAGKLLAVPPICLEGVGLSFGPENKLEAHPLRWIRARTSAQGEPSDGSRS